MVSAGLHRGKIIAPTADPWGTTPVKEDGSGGSDFVQLSGVITEGEFKGQMLSWTGWFTDKAMARTIDSLKYCGCTFPNNDVTDLTGVDANEVLFQVEHQTFESDTGTKTFARIAFINSLARGVNPEVQMDPSRKASFKQKMMGQIAQSKMGKSGNGGTGAAGASTPAGKIPF